MYVKYMHMQNVLNVKMLNGSVKCEVQNAKCKT